MKSKIIYLIIIVGSILLSFLIILQLKENSKCTSNPFIYGINRIKDSAGNDINSYCKCIMSSKNGIGEFSFDNKRIYPMEQSNNTYQKYNYNYSILS